jgi:hypothetical protein
MLGLEHGLSTTHSNMEASKESKIVLAAFSFLTLEGLNFVFRPSRVNASDLQLQGLNTLWLPLEMYSKVYIQ